MTIVVAGAGGDLGVRIVKSLTEKGANVRAITRSDYDSRASLVKACTGATCIVSAVNGLRDVIIDRQAQLIDAAVEAGVPRFIASDYSIDFRQLAAGSNRNFDLRRELHRKLDTAPIKATSIFNGAFADMLTGAAPFILYKVKRVPFWHDADQKLEFTTKDNIAAFTAAAALDDATPRTLFIAGDRITARELAASCTKLSGQQYKIMRAGTLGTLSLMIKVMKTLMPAPTDPFPPWQGMQYFHNMFSGQIPLAGLDNDRYPGMRWTRVEEVLSAAKW